MPGLLAFGDHQRPARNRPRHRLPQHRRGLERGRLGLNTVPVMTPGGRLLADVTGFWRMSQTSIERLRDYLAQLPPQAQALLMREFERAIERGEDTTVATFVLEQLRKVVRGSDDEVRPRTDDPARLLFRPLEPFLIDSNFPVRPGQIRRASLLPVWQWLIRDGAPDQSREFEAALALVRETGTTSGLESAIRKFQLATADAIFKIATPVRGGDKPRELARIGPPNVIDDMLPIGSVLQAREALDGLSGRLPSNLRILADPQIGPVTA